jgi:hypothetical protein
MIHELIAHSFYNCGYNRRSFFTNRRPLFPGSLQPSCEEDVTPETEKWSRTQKSTCVDCTAASIV